MRILVFTLFLSISIAPLSAQNQDIPESEEIQKSLDSAFEEFGKALEDMNISEIFSGEFSTLFNDSLSAGFKSIPLDSMMGMFNMEDNQFMGDIFKQFDMKISPEEMDEQMKQGLKMLEGMDMQQFGQLFEQFDFSQFQGIFDSLDIQSFEGLFDDFNFDDFDIQPGDKNKEGKQQKKKIKRI